jgi:putative ABC transport system permease protein
MTRSQGTFMANKTLGERVYRRLLRLYPRDFCDDYAEEMTGVYRDRVRGEGAAGVWLALAADLARTAPREQLSTLFQDLRHAWRAWRRTPVLALAAVLTLAPGVGANTAVFSVVHGVLLRSLPYPEADRLVEVFEDNTRAGGGPFFRVSLLNYLSWVERARSFDALAAFSGRDFTITEQGDPERLLGSAVTASLFKVLGVAPRLGRPLGVEDERPGAPPVCLLAESFWRRGYGGDPGVVGRSITLNGIRHRIVGIVPANFRELGRTQIGSAGVAQVFVPLAMDTAQSRGNHTLRVVGRLRPQISLDQGRDEMHRLAAGMEAEFPATNRNWGVRIEPLHHTMFEPRVRLSLLVLLGAVGVVLLIACANVTNLLLARATSRQRELALRAALGARPARLARQLLTESVALAMVSGICGVTAAILSMQALRTLVPSTIPRVDEIGLDPTVLGFGLTITIACGLFFGLAPATRGARADLLPGLTHGGRGVPGSSPVRWRHGLVVAQTGLATMLVVMAALLLQSLVRLQQVPLGFEPEGVLTARLSVPRVKYPDAAGALAFHRSLLASLETLPSVQAVGLMTSVPFTPGVRRGVTLRDRAAAGLTAGALEQVVSPGLFRALGMRLLAGREFGAQDHPGSPLVAIVSEGLARRLWNGADGMGRVLEFDGRSHAVVGVVEDSRGTDGTARGGGLDRDPSPVLYLPSAHFPQTVGALVIRTDARLEAILPAIRAAIRDVEPSQPVPGLRPLDEWIAETAAQPRLTTILAAAFAAAASFLTAVGIYGVVSYGVGQRTQEIGVRMALGAARWSVVGLVLRGGMTWAGGGILLGLFGAWSVNRAIATLLFDTSAADPLTFAATALALAGVAGLACTVPAIRATRIDPMMALRGD